MSLLIYYIVTKLVTGCLKTPKNTIFTIILSLNIVFLKVWKIWDSVNIFPYEIRTIVALPLTLFQYSLGKPTKGCGTAEISSIDGCLCKSKARSLLGGPYPNLTSNFYTNFVKHISKLGRWKKNKYFHADWKEDI